MTARTADKIVRRRDRREGVGIVDRLCGWAAHAPLADGDEPVMLIERQPAKDDGVHDRENGGRGPNAQGEHEQSDRRERPRGAQGANRRFEMVVHDGSLTGDAA